MDILKLALDWAKDEIFSAIIFILFGILFIIATLGFWQLGKTEIAKAFIYPTLIAGTLFLLAGISFYFSNTSKLSNFESQYKSNPSAFIKKEIERTEKTMSEYKNVAFKIFPVLIALTAILMIFINKPIWRTSSITIILFLVILILIDLNANSRIESYHEALKLANNNI
ncbi:hypothetical protein [uncultured Tenacibaculum sp.]|uniref:hypothetical protein n=1 Tax=uncultured Tenacibaculum sp. TaxID=174713 RepID=UPI0026147C5D|nr:hypothetical protein [uncultured Tenacibaculum sp.]